MSLCECGCGQEAGIIAKNHTASGYVVGEYYRFIKGHRKRHGHRARGGNKGACPSRTYTTWQTMKQRCLNPNHDAWYRYGGMGITICSRWRDSFENFLTDMGERPEGRTLDRIDKDGNYEPGNCRWATPLEQSNNKRRLEKVY